MERIELFDNYINNQLSDVQRSEFDAKLKADEEFASAFKVYLLTVNGICQEAHQDNLDFGMAMKHLTKQQLFDIIRRKEGTVSLDDIIDKLHPHVLLNPNQVTDLAASAALNDIDDDDYIDDDVYKGDEKELMERKESDLNKQSSLGNYPRWITLIFIFIIILLIIISIMV